MQDNFADVLDSRFAFIQRRKWGVPIQGLKYWQQRNTSRAYEMHGYASAGGIVPKARDVDPIPQMHVIPGFNNTYTPEEFKLGIRIGERLRETDQYSVVDRHMSDLLQAGTDTIELYAALPFNTTFDSVVEWTCADGMNLVDSARPAEGPGVASWSNLETSAALSPESIATMRLNFRKNVNEWGRKRPLKMETLVVGADLEDTAEVALTTPKKVGTDLNDNSVFAQRKLKLEVWDYLTSTTGWFGFGAKNDLHELYWYWGVRPGVKPYDCGNPDVRAYRMRMVFVTGADRPMNVRGNDGIGS